MGIRQRMQRSRDTAAAGATRERRRASGEGLYGEGEWLRSLIGLLVGLAVLAVVLYLAWSSGLIG